MSSDEVIALATDALRGQLLSVLPSDASVIVGAPLPEGQAVSELFVHLFRIAVSRYLGNFPLHPVRPD